MLTEEQVVEAHAFYSEALAMLNETKANYMLGGAFAFFHYTGIFRDTKDLDVFCKASEYPRIMKFFSEKGYRTELTDVRWLAKIFKDDYYIDIIFDTVNNICRVDDLWYKYAVQADFKGNKVLLIAPEELIWAKIYVQNRERYDGADINHVILKQGKTLDWERVLSHMEQHWHLLLAQIINFQFVYPSDFHEIIPRWLFDELMKRAHEQYDLPSPVEKVCRGPIIDQTQYSTDIKEWNYKVTTMRTV
ncbi:MAG TPA: nucleotidyltransferase [Bacteroidales bacterium]|nr:nucleotidyltransferase [Bacteroidales bacterium]